MKAYFEEVILHFIRKQTNTHTLYDCRDIGGFLQVTILWIHTIHQNLHRAQWAGVGNNIDYRDNRFVYGYMTQPLSSLPRHAHRLVLGGVLSWMVSLVVAAVWCVQLVVPCVCYLAF